MSRVSNTYMSAPDSLIGLGIDFLTGVGTAASQLKHDADAMLRRASDRGSVVSEAPRGMVGSAGQGPAYGVMMFRRPSQVELDQGYSVSDYFLTSPSAVESPFGRRAPVDVGLLTPESPSAAVRVVPDMKDSVLYGDVNSVLERIASGLGATASAVGLQAKRTWSTLSPTSKSLIGAAGALYGGKKLINWMGTTGGRNFMLTRALRRGLSGNEAAMFDAAASRGEGDDAVSTSIHELEPAITTTTAPYAALLAAESPGVGVASDERALVTAPIDFFKAAYGLGRTFAELSVEPTFVYDFMTGDPDVTYEALRHLKAPCCYIAADGTLVRSATPYAAPFFMAGGALWDKIKSGVKKLGSKLIDGAQKLMESPIGSAITSIVPFGGIAKTAVNVASKIKNAISGLTSGGDPSGDSPHGDVAMDGIDHDATGNIAVTEGTPPSTPQKVEASSVVAAASEVPLDELAGRDSLHVGAAKLPTSWSISPECKQLGATLDERLDNMSAAAAGDPLQGVVPLVMAPWLAFLLETALSTSLWYGIDAGDNGIRQSRKKRDEGEAMPPDSTDCGVAPVVQTLVRDWLQQTQAIQDATSQTSDGPGSGAPLGALVRVAARFVSRLPKRRAVGGAAKTVFKKGLHTIATKSGALKSWVLRGIKKKPGAWIKGSLAAAFIGYSFWNRNENQRAEIVDAVVETLQQLQQAGFDAVVNPQLAFIAENRQQLIKSATKLDNDKLAQWEAIIQYVYAILTGYPDADLTGSQRMLLDRCNAAGDELKKADPDAYALLANATGIMAQEATGVDPEAEEAAQKEGDPEAYLPGVDDETQSSESAPTPNGSLPPDAQALMAGLGLTAAVAPSLMEGQASQPALIDGGASPEVTQSPTRANEAAITTGEMSTIPDANLTPEQANAVEQAASIMAVSSDGDGDDPSVEKAAFTTLTNAGLSAAAAAVIIAQIRAMRRDRRGTGDDGKSSAWTQARIGSAAPSRMLTFQF